MVNIRMFIAPIVALKPNSVGEPFPAPLRRMNEMTEITREQAERVAVTWSLRMFLGHMPTKEQVELALKLRQEKELSLKLKEIEQEQESLKLKEEQK